MAFSLYNTLTLKQEPVVPLENNHIRMYTCGPTVHDNAHIGNFRTFVQQDLLRRYIRYKGFKLTHVMNITDVDDNIITKARDAGVPIGEYTQRYAQAFLDDMERMRIQKPEIMPRATQHVDGMVHLIQSLADKGITYESDGSTYFRIERFPSYGKLAHLDATAADQAQTSERIDSDRYDKENPRDFVLWKGRKPGEEFWDTPLGCGRPGWHIECSAMSMQYLGPSFDIHCGGIDLIFPHHENEIAQSEAATGKPFVRHWFHIEFLMVEGQKMSKSLGNFFTLRDLLEKGYNPIAIRYLLLSVHYRKQLNFTFDGLEQASAAVQRVNDFLARIREIPEGAADDPQLDVRIEQARRDFEGGLDDDLNTSVALAALFELIRDVNMMLDKGHVGAGNREKILKLFSDANGVFDVFEVTEQRLEDEEVAQMIEERIQARRNRNFKRADEIRDLLGKRGIALEDTKEGTRWKRVL